MANHSVPSPYSSSQPPIVAPAPPAEPEAQAWEVTWQGGRAWVVAVDLTSAVKKAQARIDSPILSAKAAGITLVL